MAGQDAADGTPFGRYRLIELLGRGGMGEVWRGFDTDTDRVVAIKVLPANLSDNEMFQQRFRREAHAAARLNSPHVIPIHHYGEIDGRLYVDMRLIEGRDLEAVLAEGPIVPARALRIIEGVAEALQAAHKVGLVHRDVKPSNILLDENDFAYLIDFGIARAIEETRLTSTGSTIGTFHYMAPERLGDHPIDDARADIYALACVLYECLTGQPPFAGASMGSLVAAHLHTPPPQPSASQPNIPKQVDQVIAKGMAKDPDQRYATTVELASAAHDAITVLIQPATPSSAPVPTPPQPRSQPQTWPSADGASQSPGPPSGTPRQTVPPPGPSRRGRKRWIIAGVAIVVAILASSIVYWYASGPPPEVVPGLASRWHITNDGGETHDWLFSADGHVNGHGGDRWTFTGSTLTVTVNDAYATYTAQVAGKQLKDGKAHNIANSSWTFTGVAE